MTVITVERGRIINATPDIVACMWNNWEIYDALLGKKFNIIRTKNNLWVGEYKGVRISVELISSKETQGSGEFKYLVCGKKFGFMLDVLFTLQYSETKDQRTSVFGKGQQEVKGMYTSLWHMIYKNKMIEAADMIIDGGEKSCTMVASDFEKAKILLTEDQVHTVEYYLNRSTIPLVEPGDNFLLDTITEHGSHSVFISHASEDKEVADAVCAYLENKGIQCWIAPRNVLPSVSYPKALIQAINQSKIMVIIFSANANKSPQINREVERAVNRGIPIIPFRIDNTIPSDEMEYFLSTPHWLDANISSPEKYFEKLAATTQILLEKKV